MFSYIITAAAQPGSGFPDVMLMNPCLNVNTPSMQDSLTDWEIAHFMESDLVVIWFHKYTPCKVCKLLFCSSNVFTNIGRTDVPAGIRTMGTPPS